MQCKRYPKHLLKLSFGSVFKISKTKRKENEYLVFKCNNVFYHSKKNMFDLLIVIGTLYLYN